jgi:D-sedoheptulose 7-phosphate isomerase
MRDVLTVEIDELIASLGSVLRAKIPTIERAAKAVVATYREGGKVLIAGNGGSAADAQHFAGEMMGWFLDKERDPFPAIALTTDTSVMTSIANDSRFENVFARQVIGLGAPEDVFIGISTSGKSPNVIRAVRAAKAAVGMRTIALCGEPGSPLAAMADVIIEVPGCLTPGIQAIHHAVLHGICRVVELELSV